MNDTTAIQQHAIDQALAVMDAHIVALNAHDRDALAATLHFPHYRISGVEVKIWPTQEQYFDDFLARAGGEWSYSRFNDIRVVQASPYKVHLDAEILRFRADHSLLNQFRSLWVLTLDDGVWAARFRSSFAGK